MCVLFYYLNRLSASIDNCLFLFTSNWSDVEKYFVVLNAVNTIRSTDSYHMFDKNGFLPANIQYKVI